MEDPIKFDLWGTGTSESRAWLIEELVVSRPELSRTEILRRVWDSVRRGSAIQLAGSLGWENATLERRRWLEHVPHVQVFQAGYGPAAVTTMHNCASHELFYAGCLGCPVCGGAFEP